MSGVIAIFYTSQISWIALIMSLIVFIVLVLANRFKVKYTFVYVILGIVLWICILKSGIHATIAGVLLGISLLAGKNIHEFKSSIANGQLFFVSTLKFINSFDYAENIQCVNIDLSKVKI